MSVWGYGRKSAPVWIITAFLILYIYIYIYIIGTKWNQGFFFFGIKIKYSHISFGFSRNHRLCCKIFLLVIYIFDKLELNADALLSFKKVAPVKTKYFPELQIFSVSRLWKEHFSF